MSDSKCCGIFNRDRDSSRCADAKISRQRPVARFGQDLPSSGCHVTESDEGTCTFVNRPGMSGAVQ